MIQASHVTITKIHVGSDASKNAALREGMKIVSAGRSEKSLHALTGEGAERVASQFLHGSPNASFVVVLEKGKPIVLHHSQNSASDRVELLPPPPPPIDAEYSIPAVEDERGCNIRAMEQLIKNLTEGIQKGEMVSRPLDDRFSEEFHRRFLDANDPEHLIFQAGDIQGFAEHELRHDDDFKEGIPWYPFRVQTVLLERLSARLKWVDEVLAMPPDLKSAEVYHADRETAKHPETAEAAKVLWSGKVKRERLRLIAEGMSAEEASTHLREKYHRLMSLHEHRCTGRLLGRYLDTYAAQFGPFTRYYLPAEASRKTADLGAEGCGFGFVIGPVDEHVMVREIFAGSPADKAGIRVGDEIVEVGRSHYEKIGVEEFGVERLMDHIPGECDAKRHLVLKRKGGAKPVAVDVVLKSFPTERMKATARAYSLDGKKVGVLRAPIFYSGRFGESSISIDMEALLAGELSDIDVVVLDLRGNPGGYLSESVAVAELFLGKQPIVLVKGKGPGFEVHTSRRKSPAYKGPLIVWTDRDTASASEIVAAAIQDNGRGVVIGDEKTVGKAHVQPIAGVSGGAFGQDPYGSYKYSGEAYFRANGLSPLREGVKPQIHFPMSTPRNGRFEQELAKMPPLPTLPSSLEKGVVAAYKGLSEVARKHETRVALDEALIKLKRVLADRQVADVLTAEKYSLELFEKEIATQRALDTLKATTVPGLNSDLNKTPYGREILKIAADFAATNPKR
ncbi:MAG: PDZ domain-containing protein [Deltaproteobacteria bacterium]|nr:PDZ domain-containing protein [Deltaproteobacteria bacterium]